MSAVSVRGLSKSFGLLRVLRDIDPSPRFDARAWRHLHMAPPTAPGQAELPLVERNPLTHHLRSLHAAL